MKTWFYIFLAMTGAVALAGCSVIDDDLSVCGNDYQLDYELRLVTNLSTELQTSLTTQTDINVASALRRHLSGIFTDHAHDVDLSFYDTQGDSLRLHRDQHIMDASQASYTLYLPIRQYMHLAMANIQDNAQVALANSDYCHAASVVGTSTAASVVGTSTAASVVGSSTADTLSSHTTGLFTARLPMEVHEGEDQHFHVRLYMANCAAALVLDTVDSHARDISVLTTGFATGFNIADSVFLYGHPSPLILADTVTSGVGGVLTFCSVSFPSPETPPTRTIIETTDPFVAPTAEESLWQFIVCVTMPDGSVTRTDLYINTPLRAGQLRVVKARVHDDGSVGSDDSMVGVSVTTNWNDGGHHNPVL